MLGDSDRVGVSKKPLRPGETENLLSELITYYPTCDDETRAANSSGAAGGQK
jgi:hypothetical protein